MMDEKDNWNFILASSFPEVRMAMSAPINFGKIEYEDNTCHKWQQIFAIFCQ